VKGGPARLQQKGSEAGVPADVEAAVGRRRRRAAVGDQEQLGAKPPLPDAVEEVRFAVVNHSYVVHGPVLEAFDPGGLTAGRQSTVEEASLEEVRERNKLEAERQLEGRALHDPLGARIEAGGRVAGSRYREALLRAGKVGERQGVITARFDGHRGGDLVAGLRAVDVVVDSGRRALEDLAVREHLVPNVIVRDSLEALRGSAKLLHCFVAEAVEADPLRDDGVLVSVIAAGALHVWDHPVAADRRDCVRAALDVSEARPVERPQLGGASGGDPRQRVAAHHWPVRGHVLEERRPRPRDGRRVLLCGVWRTRADRTGHQHASHSDEQCRNDTHEPLVSFRRAG